MKTQRKCKVCKIIVVEKFKQICDDCYLNKSKYNRRRFREIPTNKKRFCKTCNVEVEKGQSYCDYHCSRKRRIKICGFDNCKERRVKNKQSCDYHSKESRYKRYLEEIKQCHDCDVELGTRSDYRYKRVCSDCKELRNKNNKISRKENSKRWFKEKYHNDEEFRLKNLEYQKNYREQKNNLNSN